MVSNSIRGAFFEATDTVFFQRMRHGVDGSVTDITHEADGPKLDMTALAVKPDFSPTGMG